MGVHQSDLLQTWLLLDLLIQLIYLLKCVGKSSVVVTQITVGPGGCQDCSRGGQLGRYEVTKSEGTYGQLRVQLLGLRLFKAHFGHIPATAFMIIRFDSLITGKR